MELLKLDAYKTAKEFNAAWRSNKADIEGKVKENLENHNIPGAAVKLMTTALLAEVIITDLLVQIKKPEQQGGDSAKKLKFGLAINFGIPLSLLPGIDLDRVSLLIMSAPSNDFTFPERVKALGKPTPALEKASGFIEFKDAPAPDSSIKLGGVDDVGGVDWTFVTTKGARDVNKTDVNKTQIGKGNKSIEDTVTALVTDLKAVQSGKIAECEYEADGTRLKITYKTPGLKGNSFGLFASEADKLVRSAKTLEGGTNPLGEKATGFIEFKEKIADGSKITIGDAPEITLSAAPNPDAVRKTIENLVSEIEKNASKPKIAKYIYQASGNKLTFVAKEAGAAGNDATFLPASTSSLGFIQTLGQPDGGVDAPRAE